MLETEDLINCLNIMEKLSCALMCFESSNYLHFLFLQEFWSGIAMSMVASESLLVAIVFFILKLR